MIAIFYSVFAAIALRETIPSSQDPIHLFLYLFFFCAAVPSYQEWGRFQLSSKLVECCTFSLLGLVKFFFDNVSYFSKTDFFPMGFERVRKKL